MDIALYVLLDLIIHACILILIIKGKYLTWPDGIIIAGIVSFIIFLASYLYWIILFGFFIPSSILTKANSEKKKNKIIVEKASQRNAFQVLSNSFGLFIFALFQILFSGINGKIIFIFLFSGAAFIAAANSDTFSTEIGTLNKSDPHYIFNWAKSVPKGTSGGVSLQGTLGGYLGACLIAIIFVTISFFTNILSNISEIVYIFFALSFIGFSGTVIDSVLGATLQKKFYCPICKMSVEENNHPSCNTENLTKMMKYTFLDNNTVNLTSNLLVLFLGYVLIIIIHFNPN